MKKLICIIVILLMAVSCKTKQKAIETHNDKVKVETHETVNEVEAKGVTVDSVASTVSETIKVKDDSTIELTQADENKTITITDESGKSLTIKGANAKIVTSKKTEHKKDSSSIAVAKIDTTKSNKSSLKDTKIDSSSKGRKVDVETKGTSTWFWLLLLIPMAVLAYYFLKGRIKLF